MLQGAPAGEAISTPGSSSSWRPAFPKGHRVGTVHQHYLKRKIKGEHALFLARPLEHGENERCLLSGRVRDSPDCQSHTESGRQHSLHSWRPSVYFHGFISLGLFPSVYFPRFIPLGLFLSVYFQDSTTHQPTQPNPAQPPPQPLSRAEGRTLSQKRQ